jgi:hypothetical protein
VTTDAPTAGQVETETITEPKSVEENPSGVLAGSFQTAVGRLGDNAVAGLPIMDGGSERVIEPPASAKDLSDSVDYNSLMESELKEAEEEDAEAGASATDTILPPAMPEASQEENKTPVVAVTSEATANNSGDILPPPPPPPLPEGLGNGGSGVSATDGGVTPVVDSMTTTAVGGSVGGTSPPVGASEVGSPSLPPVMIQSDNTPALEGGVTDKPVVATSTEAAPTIAEISDDPGAFKLPSL